MLLREMDPNDYEKIGRLFARGPGEEVLKILSKIFYDTISFTPGKPDVSSFKEGQRDLVQILRSAVATVEKHERETADE